MTAPTVRPAVRAVAYLRYSRERPVGVRDGSAPPEHDWWPVTAIDGDTRAIAARVREVCDAETAARVLRALGITEEATTHGVV